MVRIGDSQSPDVGFKSRIRQYMVPSNKWLVHRAFNPEMLGSSPAGITVAVVQRPVPQIVDLKIWVRFPSVTLKNAVCPGGEEAVLKTVGPSGLAGSNPVCGAIGG